jgi:hypothetical protein
MPPPPPSFAPPPPPPSNLSDQTRARPQLRIQEGGSSYNDFGPISPRSESVEHSFAGGILGGSKPGQSRKPITQPTQERTAGNIMKAALQRHRKGSADSVQLHESASQQFAAPPPPIPFASAARTGTARSSISYVASMLSPTPRLTRGTDTSSLRTGSTVSALMRPHRTPATEAAWSAQ